MKKVALLFGGQGSQYSGMGKELYDSYQKIQNIYDLGSEILGFDLAKVSFEGSEEELAKTKISQPAIFALAVSALEVSREFFQLSSSRVEISAVAGHSLGEFAALYAAGAYSLADGFRIIGARAAAMEAASKEAAGAMLAVMNSTEKEIQQACEEEKGFIIPVNFNTPSQTVLSGEIAAVENVAEKLTLAGARTVRLSVSSAFHTKLMTAAAAELEGAVQGISYERTTIPFYSNITGDRLAVEDYPKYFSSHMISPVQFVKQVEALYRDGITHVIELGPKKTVANLVKRNNRKIAIYNVEDIASLQGLSDFLE